MRTVSLQIVAEWGKDEAFEMRSNKEDRALGILEKSISREGKIYKAVPRKTQKRGIIKGRHTV